MSLNNGHLVYVLDDPYIHMAVAEQFVNHGVWGVTQYGFTSSSSSVLWPVLLAFFYALFGTNSITPFVLNVVLASASVCIAYLIFRRHNLPAPISLAMLVLIIFVAPLPTLVFTGLEHLLHILCVLLFIYLVPAVLLSDAQPQERFFSSSMILLSVSGALMCLSRYEGLFMVLTVCFLFAVRRKLMHAVVLGVTALVPLGVCGIISVANGSYFLPNSLLLKSSASNISSVGGLLSSIGDFGFHQLMVTDHLLVLVGIAVFLIVGMSVLSRQIWTPSNIMLGIFVACTMMQMRFATSGSYFNFRYEAYLVVLGLVSVACAFADLTGQSSQQRMVYSRPLRYAMAGLLGLILIAPPFSLRGWVAFASTSRAANNVYQQQYQMANFLNEYYTGQGVAANDIGFISYKADIRLLDLWGLASVEVAQAKRSGYYDTKLIEALAREHRVKIAVVYASWYEPYGGLPPTWEKVGSWTVPNNVVLGDATVSFYAVDRAEAQNLRDNLEAFSAQLPKGVVVDAISVGQEVSTP